MRLLWTLLLAGVLGGVSAQGIDFFEGSWEEVLAKADQEGKLVFVDAYTSWCGPCKRMSKMVFPEEQVGDFFNERFVNYKLDMEKGEGPDFQRRYGVRSYPTLLFIDGEGEIVHRSVGAKKPDGLIDLGRQAEKKNDQSEKYLALYESGDRSYETYYMLVKSLNRVEKPSLRYANEYFSQDRDMSTPQNLKFLYEALTRVDSDILDVYVGHRKDLIAFKGEEIYMQRIYDAGMNTIEVAVEYGEESLLLDAQKKIKKHAKSLSADFDFESARLYCKRIRDSEGYVEAVRSYAAREIKNDARRLHEASKDLLKQWPEYDPAIELAESLAQQAATNSGTAEYYYHLGYIQKLRGKNSEALESLQRALKIADEEESNNIRIRALIQEIEANG